MDNVLDKLSYIKEIILFPFDCCLLCSQCCCTLCGECLCEEKFNRYCYDKCKFHLHISM